MNGNLTNAGITIVQVSQTPIENILILIQIIFFLITGFIAIATYYSARKTILQPIKTEVFKQQLVIFSEIMELFNSKKEIEIRDFFRIGEVLEINALYLVNLYAKLFFNKRSEGIEKSYLECKHHIISKEFADLYFDENKDSLKEMYQNEVKTKEERWKEYKVGMIVMSDEWRKSIDRIEKLISSPLLPKKVIELLKEILDINMNNLDELRKFLNDIVEEIPEVYRSEEDIKNDDGLMYIHNAFNKRINNYEPKVLELLDYTRRYLKVDELLD